MLTLEWEGVEASIHLLWWLHGPLCKFSTFYSKTRYVYIPRDIEKRQLWQRHKNTYCPFSSGWQVPTPLTFIQSGRVIQAVSQENLFQCEFLCPTRQRSKCQLLFQNICKVLFQASVTRMQTQFRKKKICIYINI